MHTSGRDRFLYTLDDPDNKQRRGRSFSFDISRYIDVKLLISAVFIMSMIMFGLSFLTPLQHAKFICPTPQSQCSHGSYRLRQQIRAGTKKWGQIFYHSHFASKEDIEELVKVGERLAETQKVTGGKSHASFCLRLPKDEPVPEALKRVESRMSLWSVLPPAFGEDFCWLRQEEGQAIPSVSDDEPSASDPLLTSSGETRFPKSGNGDLKVPTIAGDAVLLWNQNPDRTDNPGAIWGSDAPRQGVKWTLVRWMRERPIPH